MTTVNAVFFYTFIYHCYYKCFLFFLSFLASITDIATGYMPDFRAALQLGCWGFCQGHLSGGNAREANVFFFLPTS